MINKIRRPSLRAAGANEIRDICAVNLSKRFGEKRVLVSFNAVFPAGQVSCIMGESGCGKTTLLNIMLGVEKEDDGEIIGVPARLSAVFQEDRLCEDFSAATNVRITAGAGTTDRDIVNLLTALGLKKDIRSPVNTLSGGMKRRVAIARALLAGGGLVIMDEPFKGLDDATRAATADCIKKHLGGRTLIAVTHSNSDAQLLSASQVIKMERAGDKRADG